MSKIAHIAILLVTATAFSGCAGGAGRDPDTGLRVTGNETSVIIAPTGSEATALPLAEKHCASYGRVAHFKRIEGFRVVFDCDLKTSR